MKKILKRAHRALIHLLGGVTYDESMITSFYMSNAMELRRVRRIRSYLQLLYQTPAEDWCKQAYAYIERIEQEIVESIPEDLMKRLEDELED